MEEQIIITMERREEKRRVHSYNVAGGRGAVAGYIALKAFLVI